MSSFLGGGGGGGGGGGTPGAPVQSVQFNFGGAFAGDVHFTWYPSGTTSPGGSTKGGLVDNLHMALGNFGQLNFTTPGPGDPVPPLAPFAVNTPLLINEYFSGDLSTQQNTVIELTTGAKHTGTTPARMMGYDTDFYINSDSTGPFDQFFTGNFTSYNYGHGAVTGMAGLHIDAENLGPGNVTDLNGIEIVLNQGGTTGSLVGTIKGVSAFIDIDVHGGTATTAINFFSDATFSTGGTLTNSYGLWIEDQSLSGATGVKLNTLSRGANSNNVFEGAVTLGAQGIHTGLLNFIGTTSGAVTMRSAAAAGTWSMTLPVNAGTNLYVLQTDGTGITSWVPQTGGGGGSPAAPTGSIQYNNAGAFGAFGLVTTTTLLLTDLTPLQAVYFDSSRDQINLGRLAGHSGVSTSQHSICIGDHSGLVLTSGSSNILIGPNAGTALTTESLNIFIGSEAGRNATGNNNDVLIGNQAGLNATASGGGNLGIGQSVLSNMTTTAHANVGIGQACLTSALTGSNNMAVGSQAMNVLTTGAGNVAIGINSGASLIGGNTNVFLGTSAGAPVTSGSGNVLIGASAGASGGNLGGCVGIGTSALLSAALGGGGNDNTAIGNSCGTLITTGVFNTFVGSTCNPIITTGSRNTIIGANIAFNKNVSSSVVLADGNGAIKFWTDDPAVGSNTAVGHASGNFINQTGTWNFTANQAGNALTTGSGNVLIGLLAGSGLNTGSFNTFVGAFGGTSGVGSAVTTGSNNTILGNYAGTGAAMASQVILSDGQGNVVVQYDRPNKTWQMPTTTIGALPAAGVAGRKAFVTDSLAAPVFAATLTAGGTAKSPVYDDGAAWRYG